MGRLVYRCGTSDKIIELDGTMNFFETALRIRSTQVNYDLGFRDISNLSHPASTARIDAIFLNFKEADEVFASFSADFEYKKPGTLVADGWEQRCYLEPPDPSGLSPFALKATMNCVLLDGVWRKPKLIHLFPGTGDTEGTKTYPYTYPYRYASEYGSRSIDVAGVLPATFLMCIFGKVSNPSIKIGRNLYRVNVNIPEGGYLLLDGRDCTAKMVTADGTVSNEFSKCVRGSGEGSGTYAWEKIRPGMSNVIWGDDFGFDLTVFEERTTLPFGGA